MSTPTKTSPDPQVVSGMDSLLAGTLHADMPAEVPVGPASFVSARDILTGNCPPGNWKIEGIIIESDKLPRAVTPNVVRSPKKRAAPGSQSDVLALDLLIGDQTGWHPIIS